MFASTRQLILLALPSLAVSQEVLGCYHYNFAYSDVSANSSGVTVNSTSLCQARCAATQGCTGFTFWLSMKKCDLTYTNGLLVATPADNEGVSGPPTCPTGSVDPACFDFPSAAWPGPDAAASNAAWPAGVQPTKQQCWPRDPTTGVPTLCSPQNITVLEDIKSGWQGRCMSLENTQPNLPCDQACLQNVLCSVWSLIGENETGGSQECWQGKFGGQGCYNNYGPQGIGSQRVMHGNYRVLKNLKGMQVMGLTNMFPASTFKNSATEGPAHCRLYCIASLYCNYWQYSSVSGCWVEDPEFATVQYPLTLTTGDSTVGANTNTDDAAAIIDGEYIQHVCTVIPPTTTTTMTYAAPPPTTTTTTTTTTKAGSSMPAWMGILIFLAVVLLGAGVGAGLLYSQSKKKKSQRSVNPDVTGSINDYPPYGGDEEGQPLNADYESQMSDYQNATQVPDDYQRERPQAQSQPPAIPPLPANYRHTPPPASMAPGGSYQPRPMPGVQQMPTAQAMPTAPALYPQYGQQY